MTPPAPLPAHAFFSDVKFTLVTVRVTIATTDRCVVSSARPHAVTANMIAAHNTAYWNRHVLYMDFHCNNIVTKIISKFISNKRILKLSPDKAMNTTTILRSIFAVWDYFFDSLFSQFSASSEFSASGFLNDVGLRFIYFSSLGCESYITALSMCVCPVRKY